jgi:hypothetical protein
VAHRTGPDDLGRRHLAEFRRLIGDSIDFLVVGVAEHELRLADRRSLRRELAEHRLLGSGADLNYLTPATYRIGRHRRLAGLSLRITASS